MYRECWYCETAEADDRFAHTVKLCRDYQMTYYVVGFHESELRTQISIPCCRSCRRFIMRRKLQFNFYMYLGLVSVLAGIIGVLFAIFNETLSLSGRMTIVLVPALVLGFSVYLGCRDTKSDIELTLSRRFRSTHAYPPFARLIDDGWSPCVGQDTL